MRTHFVKSAAYWFNASRQKSQRDEAVMCMENAYNHVENALADCRAQCDELRQALRLLADNPNSADIMERVRASMARYDKKLSRKSGDTKDTNEQS